MEGYERVYILICTWRSGETEIVSVHKSKSGAETAMQKNIKEDKKNNNEDYEYEVVDYLVLN